MRHSITLIQFKVKTGSKTYEINKISLTSLDNKIYIQNYGYNGLALGHQS